MPYLILDLEMTGTEAGFHDIIQIGAVLASDTWAPLSEFESLVYPDHEDSFNAGAEAIHGISADDLDDAPSSFEALEDFEAWVRKTLKRRSQDPIHDIIVCGQSVINDIHFLQTKYKELNLKWPFSFKLIDLLSVTHFMYRIWDQNQVPRPNSYSLKAVATHFQLSRAEAHHNALEDARLTYQCFQKYFAIADQIKLK
jgi:DNA polymerase III subunit epsilon